MGEQAIIREATVRRHGNCQIFTRAGCKKGNHITWNTAAIFREVSTILVERETDIVHALHGAVLALKKFSHLSEPLLSGLDSALRYVDLKTGSESPRLNLRNLNTKGRARLRSAFWGCFGT